MLLEHELQFRVRYCETDAMGVVHHANYFNYFEMGRTELFRAQGGDYKKVEEQGFFFVIVRVSCQYHRPARYDDLLTLKTKLARVTPVKLIHHYKLFRGDELLVEGESVLACVNREGKVCRITDVLPDYPTGRES